MDKFEKQYSMLETRQKYGGSFERALIQAWKNADNSNRQILEDAFAGHRFDLRILSDKYFKQEEEPSYGKLSFSTISAIHSWASRVHDRHENGDEVTPGNLIHDIRGLASEDEWFLPRY